jgi:sialate O-acetylesterase
VPGKARLYQHQLPLLVTDWRERWGCELPVAWVQLPNFSGNGRDLPSVREAMAKTLRLPRTGMAVTIDIGETKDIHPKNKQEVGRRLSLWALHEVYGKTEVAFRGPHFSGMEIRDSTVIITVSDAKELRLKDDSLAISGFQIAGADQVWKPAQARLESGKITATSSEVNAPVAIRYAWENDPQVNLVNEAGLPLAPFRTDTW